jgi:hypothetical protein
MTLMARVKRLSKTYSEGYKVAERRKIQGMSDVELNRWLLLLHREGLNQDCVAELALIDEGLALLAQMKTDEPLRGAEWTDFSTRYEPLQDAFMMEVVDDVSSRGRSR